jgi:hypothetical protein
MPPNTNKRRPPMAPEGPITPRRSPPRPQAQAPLPPPPDDIGDDDDGLDGDERPARRTMENYDNSFEDDVANEGFFDDPRDTFTGDQAYNQAVSRAQLAKTYYTKSISQFIQKSTLFPDTKDTLKTVASGLFDKTEVLAKTENVKLEFINVSIILARIRIGFHPMDVDNPDLATAMDMILHHYQRYISRSAGGWERGLQNVIETAHTNRNVMEQRPMMGGGMGQKKPWYKRLI